MTRPRHSSNNTIRHRKCFSHNSTDYRGLANWSYLNKVFSFSDTIMDYKERPEFSPSEHGLSPSFRLTNFSKLKG